MPHNALTASETLPGYAGRVFQATPASAPPGPYAVVTELTTGTVREYQRGENGRTPRERSVTTLVTLYGALDAPMHELRDAFTAAQELADLITHTLGGTPAAGVQSGPDLPPRQDPVSRRAYAAVRFVLTYRTGV